MSSRASSVRFCYAIVIFLGCTLLAPDTPARSSDYKIKIDAIHHPDPAGRALFSYEIAARPPAADDQPAYLEAVQHVRTALSGCGLFEAPPGVTPDLTIEIDCGITAPRSETKTRSIAVAPPPQSTLPPGTSPFNYVTIEYRVLVQLKYLLVTARAHGSATTVWRVQAALDDETSDLEPLLPLLAAAVMNQVGHDTRGTQTMTLSARDTDVAFINQGMP